MIFLKINVKVLNIKLLKIFLKIICNQILKIFYNFIIFLKESDENLNSSYQIDYQNSYSKMEL